jgi:serine/threonine protein kinase
MHSRSVGYRGTVRRAREDLVAGRYRLGEVLGRGGMGEVYRATDEVLGRQVAIKLMRPVAQTLAIPERFLREARAAASVHSAHVVATYDFGGYDGGYYLAMELVSGRSASDALRRDGLFSPERAEQVVRQAAAGLAVVHRQGIVHRDVKPSNLLLAADGTVKIADFGIVRFLDDETTTTLTSTGEIVGTSHYLSPERALGEPATPASDVYALGCVLYQLVTGRPPFVGEAPASIMYQHVQKQPIPPRQLCTAVTAELEALILWMLDKNPDRRPTAAEVADGAAPPVPSDLVETTRLQSVRRLAGRPVLAGTAATFAVVLFAVLGIFLETRGVDLPATNDLTPDHSATTPAAVPGTASTPEVEGTATTPSTRPSARTPKVSSTRTAPRTESKAARPTGPRSHVKRAEPTKPNPGKPEKPGKPGKTKKPKH